jgi:hypothetical protein
MMKDSHRTPNKEYTKPAATSENEESPPSPERNRTKPSRKRLRKQEHETDHIKTIFSTFTENTQTQLREQEEKRPMEIAAMKRANMDTHNILRTKKTPAQTMNDHITTAHFKAMAKHLKPSSTEHQKTGRHLNTTS